MLGDVSARPNRTIQVTVRVASFILSDAVLEQAKVALRNYNLVGRILGHKPDDAVEMTFHQADGLFVDYRSIADGVDVHIHFDVRGEPKPSAEIMQSAAIIALQTLFPDGDFCYLLTVNHDVSVILPRRRDRKEVRIVEVAYDITPS